MLTMPPKKIRSGCVAPHLGEQRFVVELERGEVLPPDDRAAESGENGRENVGDAGLPVRLVVVDHERALGAPSRRA